MGNGSAAKKATAADLLRLEPEESVEIVDGEIVEKALPSFEHGNAQGGLVGALRPRFGRNRGGSSPGGWWIVTEVDVEYEPHQLFRHDLVGWRRDRLPERPTQRPVRTRPDWVCEILSPSNWATDTVTKLRKLRSSGVPHYWLVDLEHGVLTIYRHSDGEYLLAALARPGERARLEPFEEVELEVSVLFGEDPADG